MKILVTGGCGFIGSRLVEKLLLKGHEVIVADNLSKPESSIKEGYRFIQIDLSNKEEVLKIFKEGFDLCISLAAKIGGIGYFHKVPATILSDNNDIYSSTFEAAAKTNTKVIYVSSSVVFECANKFPTKEEDVRNIPVPRSSYGFSKLIGEQYCKAFHEQYGLDYSIVRPFNAYGINEAPGEEVGYAHVIPDLIKKILSKKELEILGDGNQIRCYTHIDDLTDGIITVMEHPNSNLEDYNISSSDEIKVIDLAKILWKLCGRKDEFKVKYVDGFKDDVVKRIPDTSKIRSLNWKTKVKFEDGLKEVVEWIKNMEMINETKG